jgi:hypothetical protein
MAAYELDPVSAWIRSNNIPLAREAWVEVNWFGEKTQADLQPDEVTEVPFYLDKRNAADKHEEGRAVDILSATMCAPKLPQMLR